MNFPMLLAITTVVLLFLLRFVPPVFFLPVSSRSIAREDDFLHMMMSMGKRVRLRAIMQIAVSIAMGVPALYIILSLEYPAEDKKWAYGMVGYIWGLWTGH